MADAVMVWRKTINTSAFCVLLEKARSEANVWALRGNLLKVVFLPKNKTHEATPAFGTLPPSVLRHPAARLPAAGWVRGGGRRRARRGGEENVDEHKERGCWRDVE